MLYTIKNKPFGDYTSDNLKIVHNNKYGIVNSSDNTYIINEEYDNIFLYGINTFILYQNGKVGMCRIENNHADILCRCEYDIVDNINHNLFFSNDIKTRYYNSVTGQIMDFTEITIDIPYIYCSDNEYQYIIYEETGEVIYKRKYNRYNKSCYVYYGDTDKGAVFYDVRYSMYLYPSKSGYKYYQYPINNSIIVNRNNICNIAEDENGIGVIDSFGNMIIKNSYDVISIEIKIKAQNQHESIEKTIPLSKEIYRRS